MAYCRLQIQRIDNHRGLPLGSLLYTLETAAVRRPRLLLHSEQGLRCECADHKAHYEQVRAPPTAACRLEKNITEGTDTHNVEQSDVCAVTDAYKKHVHLKPSITLRCARAR